MRPAIVAICALAFLAVGAFAQSPAVDEPLEGDQEASYEDDDEAFSQAGGQPDDQQEVANLPEDQQQFEQFCKDTRDYIFADINSNVDRTSSRVYSAIFGAAAQIVQDSKDVMDKTSGRIAGTLENPNAPIAPASDDDEKVAAETQEAIANSKSAPTAFLDGFKGTISAVSRRVGESFNQQVERLKGFANINQIAKTLTVACDKVAQYDAELKKQFDEFKSGVSGADKVKFQNVQCLTLRRVNRLDGLCKFTHAAQEPFGQMFGLEFGQTKQ